ncbi:MAG: hypothetical protein ONB47_08945 [candidate division KSB1 bacterium]|nr:hypothetical protein [candidate division KSB1 bacterium]
MVNILSSGLKNHGQNKILKVPYPQRMEEPNGFGFHQLGSSIRWEKSLLFLQRFSHKEIRVSKQTLWTQTSLLLCFCFFQILFHLEFHNRSIESRCLITDFLIRSSTQTGISK